ncbi:endo-1,4-beta-xylanase [Wenyingzhuangia sp. IMCC45574]
MKAILDNILKNLLFYCFLCTLSLLGQTTCEKGLQDWGKYESVKQEAIQRIEKYRKGNVVVRMQLPNGELATNGTAKVSLKRHAFKWGAVVNQYFATSPYADRYKALFLKYFNATGFTVALKPKFRNKPIEAKAENISMPWFLANDFYVRGHTLFWDNDKFMRPEDKAIYNTPDLSDTEKGALLLASCKKHFVHAIPKWNVQCWDVSNEPIGNNKVNKLFANKDTHVHWFQLADSIRKVHGKDKVQLFQNDYQVITAIAPWALSLRKKGYKGIGRPAIYKETIRKQLALGAPIEGIGFQSRIKMGLLSPDSIYQRLCSFDEFNLPYHATEFEIRDDKKRYVYTDAERRLLTEYMMVLYFSHPKVEGFWHWTFLDKPKGGLDYPLFNYDGTPKVNGQKWMELMDGFLTTQKELSTNAHGEVQVKGYYGSYQVEVEHQGKQYTGTFQLEKGAEHQEISVVLRIENEQ